MNRIRSKLVLGNRNQLLTLNTERRVCAIHTNHRNILTLFFSILYIQYCECSYGNAMIEKLRRSLQVRDKQGVHDNIVFFCGFLTGLFEAVIIVLSITVL